MNTVSRSMGRFQHGGDVYGLPGVIDFSANINPLGMPPAAQQELVRQLDTFENYPDGECRDLRQAIARAEGTQMHHIVCTAGASDLFQRLCRVLKPHMALVTAPSFSGYEEALEQVGAQVTYHELREQDGFNLTRSILGFSRHAAAPDILFLCNPNNPTGLTLGRDLILRILNEAKSTGITVVLDECFLDFTDQRSAVDLCPEFPNLVVVRAFTKTYAMAGLRLGYGTSSDTQLIRRLAKAGQPWAVSGPAQVAAIAALQQEEWIPRTQSYVRQQRAVLAAGLQQCGMRVIPGQANYLLFQSPKPLYEPLLQRGFLIRRCQNFQGLDDSWYRIAVRTAVQNCAFLEALKEVCA